MDLIPNSGFTLMSLVRGFIGMLSLLFIAYLFSVDRKQIAWKTVGLGLLTQVIIAIGVLKVDWVKSLFEGLGGFFINVLEYTGEGAKMLLGQFGDVDQYGFIFVFQALPVIIFFSALSSILYYFGIIQKVVGFLAWGLTKLLKFPVLKVFLLQETFF
jgi:CNT family concentrative nucleoside transporter